jgi:hypothetical protein
MTKCSLFFPQTSKGRRNLVANYIHEWDDHWKALNASFEETLNADENLQDVSS